MTRVQTGLFVGVLIVIAAAVAGVVGAGAAIALVKTSYNGPVGNPQRAELAVHSDELGETVILGLHLPVEYSSEPDRRFPVIWVLDGPSQGLDVHRATQTLSRIGAAEPAIVVEVPHSSSGRDDDFRPPVGADTTWGAQADRFLRFLESEAAPAVEDAFRTDSVRLLVGHSLGGFFTLFAFAERPELFDAFLAFSPSVWVGDEMIIPILERSLSGTHAGETFVYVNVGAREDNEMVSGFDRVRTTLEAHAPPGVRWRTDVTSGADHMSSPTLAYPVAVSEFWRY